MRRSLAVTGVVALVLAAGASAATIRGTARGELLRGTSRPDRVDARAGADRVNVVGGGRDTVACGRGRDIVTVDEADVVAADCEVVSRRIAVDPQTGISAGQHRTQLESHSLANGSTIVSVFQNGRYVDGGATAIGFSTSTDGGRTWRSGLLPGVTRYSPSPGDSARASDPVVAYDALHGVWLASTLIVANDYSGLYVNRSPDGLNWGAPVVAARASIGSLAYDKNWIACDNGAASPFRGNCYLAYTDLGTSRLALQISRDGGMNWTAQVTVDASTGADVVGALPLVQPNGALTVVFLSSPDGIYAARSTDGGLTFGRRVGVAPLDSHSARFLRAPPLPAATVDAAGRMYVTWADCAFRSACDANDLVLTTSADGITWTGLTRLPRVGFEPFVPGIAAHPTIPGRLALVTYVRANGLCDPTTCRVGVVFTSSTNGGGAWAKPQRLDAEQMLYGWLADSNAGAFLGDYLGIAYTEQAAVPTFPLATRPSGKTFNESMFASVLPA